MWRNILGHAYYQITVLMIVIFAGEGWLVQEYSRSCILKSATESYTDKDGNTQKVCQEYNPYFAQTLYVDDNYHSWWSN